MTGGRLESIKRPTSLLIAGARARLVDHKCSCEGSEQSCAKCAGDKPRRKNPDHRQSTARRKPSGGHFDYDFGHLRVHSGLRGRDARCHAGEPCEDDPLVDYQGHGSTTCDKSTGTMGTTLTEHCAGDCVAQHEAIHRRDRSTCCSRVKKCRDNAGEDATKKAACDNAFDTWFPKLSDWTECNAYRREVTCLTSFIANNCGTPRGEGVTAACCTTLKEELEFAKGERDTRCAGAVNEPCSIKADGTIA
jgi:hypothetical protein